MSNKLQKIFSKDPEVVNKEIKNIINEAYQNQWCTTCKNVYYKDAEGIIMKCKISENLCQKRSWSCRDTSTQYCLFYETKNRGE